MKYVYVIKNDKPCKCCEMIFRYCTDKHKFISGTKKQIEWLKGGGNNPFAGEMVKIKYTRKTCITFKEYIIGKNCRNKKALGYYKKISKRGDK